MLSKDLNVNSIDVVKKILGDDYEFLKIQKQRLFGLEIQNYRLVQEIEQLQHKYVNFIDLAFDLTQLISSSKNLEKEDLQNLLTNNYMLSSFSIGSLDKLKELIADMKISAIKNEVVKENMNFLMLSDKEIRKDKFLESIAYQVESLDTIKYEISRMLEEYHKNNESIENTKLDALCTNMQVFNSSNNVIELYTNLSRCYANLREVLTKLYSKYHNLIQDSKFSNDVEQALAASQQILLADSSSKQVFQTLNQEDLLRMLITQSIMIEEKLGS